MYTFDKQMFRFNEVPANFDSFVEYKNNIADIPNSVTIQFHDIACAFDCWMRTRKSEVALFRKVYFKDLEHGCHQFGICLTRMHTVQYITFFGYTTLITRGNGILSPWWVLDSVSIETVGDRAFTPIDGRSTKHWKRRSVVTLNVEHSENMQVLSDHHLTELIFDTIEYERVLASDRALNEPEPNVKQDPTSLQHKEKLK